MTNSLKSTTFTGNLKISCYYLALPLTQENTTFEFNHQEYIEPEQYVFYQLKIEEDPWNIISTLNEKSSSKQQIKTEGIVLFEHLQEFLATPDLQSLIKLSSPKEQKQFKIEELAFVKKEDLETLQLQQCSWDKFRIDYCQPIIPQSIEIHAGEEIQSFTPEFSLQLLKEKLLDSTQQLIVIPKNHNNIPVVFDWNLNCLYFKPKSYVCGAASEGWRKTKGESLLTEPAVNEDNYVTQSKWFLNHFTSFSNSGLFLPSMQYDHSLSVLFFPENEGKINGFFHPEDATVFDLNFYINDINDYSVAWNEAKNSLKYIEDHYGYKYEYNKLNDVLNYSHIDYIASMFLFKKQQLDTTLHLNFKNLFSEIINEKGIIDYIDAAASHHYLDNKILNKDENISIKKNKI